MKQQPKEPRRFKTVECHTCGDRHESSRMISLELSNTDDKYYTVLPAGHESQGWFELCPDCAESATRHIEEAAQRTVKLEKIRLVKEELGWNNEHIASLIGSTKQNVNNALAPSSKQALPKWAEAMIGIYDAIDKKNRLNAALKPADSKNDHVSAIAAELGVIYGTIGRKENFIAAESVLNILAKPKV